METQLQNKEQSDIVEKIVMKGDISSLSSGEKVKYYNAMCGRIGLDPMTQPFQLLNLQGKQVLYCTKGGAEQINKIYHISHEIRKKEKVDDIYIVEVRASQIGGRYVDEMGAVNVKGLSGDNLVNAMLKSVTKAKRRATLSIMGLGMLDETEAETIPNAQKVPFVPKVDAKETDEEFNVKPLNKTIDVEAQPKNKLECTDCGIATPPKVADFSRNRLGRVICFDCQHKPKEPQKDDYSDEAEEVN